MIAVWRSVLYNIIESVGFLESKYGGERLRPDDGKTSCMSRTPVGLANHPAIKLKWQLSVAHGCLIGSPSCRALPVGSVRASDSRLAEPVFRAGKARLFPK